MNEQNSKKNFINRIIMVLLAVAVFVVIFNLMSEGGGLPIHSDAPDFRLPVVNDNGGAVALSDYKGKVVIVDFFSTSCPPCMREIAVLKALQKNYGEDKLVVLGVAVGGERIPQLANFTRQRQIRYPVVADLRGVAGHLYQVSTLPTLYIVDGQGQIRQRHMGFWPLNDLDATLQEILK